MTANTAKESTPGKMEDSTTDPGLMASNTAKESIGKPMAKREKDTGKKERELSGRTKILLKMLEWHLGT